MPTNTLLRQPDELFGGKQLDFQPIRTSNGSSSRHHYLPPRAVKRRATLNLQHRMVDVRNGGYETFDTFVKVRYRVREPYFEVSKCTLSTYIPLGSPGVFADISSVGIL